MAKSERIEAAIWLLDYKLNGFKPNAPQWRAFLCEEPKKWLAWKRAAGKTIYLILEGYLSYQLRERADFVLPCRVDALTFFAIMDDFLGPYDPRAVKVMQGWIFSVDSWLRWGMYSGNQLLLDNFNHRLNKEKQAQILDRLPQRAVLTSEPEFPAPKGFWESAIEPWEVWKSWGLARNGRKEMS